MDTNRHTTRAGRRAALLLAGAGLGAGFVWGPARDGLAQPVGRPPAARLAPPQPLAPADVAARAAPVEFQRPMTPTQDPRPAPPRASTIPESWVTPPSASPPRPQPAPQPTGVWGSIKGVVSGGTRAVKAAIVGRPDEPPQPRIGQTFIPRPPQQPPAASTRPAGWEAPPPPVDQPPLQGTSPNGSPVYAGNPAYRWYGWGTVTPGMNPYAPGGEYPPASANWYAQSGATPGAFPVPVANPFRPPPGSGPPAYLVSAAPPPAPRVASTYSPPAPRPIAESPPVVYALPAGPVPPPWRPPPGVPATIVPGPPEPRWQSAPTATPFGANTPHGPGPIVPAFYVQPAAPVARGQEPADDADAKLARLVRAACEGLVANVTVARTGPNQLAVSFAATTETLAEIAARAVSAVPELRPVAVEFKATITGR